MNASHKIRLSLYFIEKKKKKKLNLSYLDQMLSKNSDLIIFTTFGMFFLGLF